MGVGSERLDEPSVTTGPGEIVDDLGGGHEADLETVLDGLVGDSDRKVGLASAGLAQKDQSASIRHESGGEKRSDLRGLKSRLAGEVEFLDCLEEREVSAPHEPLDAGLLAMGDLLGDEGGEEVTVGPLLLLGALREAAPGAGCIGEMQTTEERLEGDVLGVHRAASSGSGFRKGFQ
jgi:hypothetical protein